ncbi:MAG: hypothetical protein M3Q62_01390 [Actinomycetota bacterium]|jgi:hypothetical protein|nr:hypothetical protein [Rubrobacteraceae bacterium]MBA3634944.1 hypothetical protein [Rubrobacteraceae bacterium]MBA3701794.1 hypothetical protein [Rubrobacteraceae bacterium]MDQ3182202.1 hypothetical protein [Actinomycetota bacterium]MDQ3498275.1 hypothetical protein [Actinomycetota bacterium]
MIRRDKWSFEGAMEDLRRKEHGTSATIAEAGGLAVRTRLYHPLLFEKVDGRGYMLHWLSNALHLQRLIAI